MQLSRQSKANGDLEFQTCEEQREEEAAKALKEALQQPQTKLAGLETAELFGGGCDEVAS